MEFILCVLIIIILLSFFIEINITLKNKFEQSPNITLKIKEIKTEYLKENNWEVKYENYQHSKSTSNSN